MTRAWRGILGAMLTAGLALALADGPSGGRAWASSLMDDDPYPEDNTFSHQLAIDRIVARQRAAAIWRRFSPFLLALEKGGVDASAARAFISPVKGEGSAAQGWSLWLSGSPAHLRNRLNVARSKGHSISSTIGLDRQLSPNLVLGLGLENGYSNIRTTYNNGRARTRTHGFSLYLNYRFNDWLSLDAQGGYVYQRQKYRRRDILGLYTGRRHAHGLSASAALNAAKWLSASWMVSGRLGLVATRDKWRKYTENAPFGTLAQPGEKRSLVQGVVEGGIAYWHEPVMPYLKVSYNHDLYRKGGASTSDRDDFTFTGGFYMFAPEGARGLSLGLSGSLIVGRKKQRQILGALQLKWSW